LASGGDGQERASRLPMAGVDIRTIAQLMGHGTLQMSMRYAHLSPDHNQSSGRSAGYFRKQTDTKADTGKTLNVKSFRILCESGEIGRRTRLRIWRGNPWGFESPLSHQQIERIVSFLTVCRASRRAPRCSTEKIPAYTTVAGRERSLRPHSK